jgi:hypothetical protein
MELAALPAKLTDDPQMRAELDVAVADVIAKVANALVVKLREAGLREAGSGTAH